MGIGNFSEGFIKGYVNPVANIDKLVRNTSSSLVNKVTDSIYNATGLGNPSSNTLPDLPTPIQNGALSKLSARQDPVMNVDWLAFIIDPDAGGAQAIDPYYIDAIQTPSLRTQTRTVYRSGIDKNYAGPFSVDSLSITLYTDRTGIAPKFASSWFHAVYDPRSGNFRLPKDYKKNIQVVFYDPAKAALYTFTFIGCFPTSLPSVTLDGGSANPIATQLELSVDDLEIDIAEEDLRQVTRAAQTVGVNGAVESSGIMSKLKSIAGTFITSQGAIVKQQGTAKVMGSLKKFF